MFSFINLPSRTRHLLEFVGLLWWRLLGHVGGSYMSIVSECSGRHNCAQILSGVFPMEMATSSAAETARHCSSRIYRMGSTCQCSGSLSFDADHNASVSTTEFNVQHVHIEQEGDDARIRTWHGHHRRNHVWQNYVGPTLRSAQFLLSVWMICCNILPRFRFSFDFLRSIFFFSLSLKSRSIMCVSCTTTANTSIPKK